MTAGESGIAKYLESKRANLERLGPKEAYEAMQKEESVILVDTRPASFRDAEGAIPGAVIIERNVLEWRLDPSSPDCIPQAKVHGFQPIIMCNEGYASSLAAGVLKELGVARATDLDGGFRRWKQEGLPVQGG